MIYDRSKHIMATHTTFEQSHPIILSAEELQSEVWRPVPGFEGEYEVSDLGRVRSIARTVHYKSKLGIPASRNIPSCMLSLQLNYDGYLYTGWRNKHFLVHRLVLQVFNPVDNAENLHCNHKNFNRQDNRLCNLEWVTPQENTQYSKEQGNYIDTHTGPIQVTDLITMQKYPSLQSAAKIFNSTNAAVGIQQSIDNRTTYNGHIFVYTSDLVDDFNVEEYVHQVKHHWYHRNFRTGRRVVELLSGDEFATMQKAADAVGGNVSGLVYSIEKHRMYKDKIFVFTETAQHSSFNADAYIRLAQDTTDSTQSWRLVPILELKSGITYPSMNKAEADLKLQPGSISYSLAHKCACGEHVFTTDIHMDIDTQKQYLYKIHSRNGQGISQRILDLTTDIEYPSYSAAGKAVGATDGSIKYAITHKVMCNGHCFVHSKDLDKIANIPMYIDECKQRSKPKVIRVDCVETGESYRNITDAAKSLNTTIDKFTYRRNGDSIMYNNKHYTLIRKGQ